MKKYLYLFLLPLLPACNNFLDVTPTDRFTQETYWTTKEQAEAALNGTYAALYYNVYAAGSVYTDALTPNSYQYNGDYNLISRGLHNAATGYFNEAWNGSYRGIGRANNLLANIAKVPMDAALKDRFIAEAKFLRALFYLPLWNNFGGAPLITAATDFENQGSLPRNKPEELLAQILKDLDEAAAGTALPVSYSGTDKGRATRGAALALKMRVLLYASRWEEAAATARQVMDLKAYTLFPNYRALFFLENEGNAEVIFDVQYRFPEFTHSLDISLDQQLGSAPLPDLLNDYYGTDGKPISESVVYNPQRPYENRDSRLQATVIVPGSQFKGATVTPIQYPSTGLGMKKYTIFKDNEKPVAAPTSNTSELNFILLRYADVLLSYAEAKNEASGPEQSVFDAINAVRGRAGMPSLASGLSREQLRAEIRHERRIELAGEGLYYHDLRRWRKADQLLNGEIRNLAGNRIDTRQFNATRDYLWPIPSIAIQNNPALTQNPGYNK
ncbi:RagB/SusD family nutrient uptake outer membrane protein [Pedobacter yulinensis]|uniref:RagB/SusD family nutrient uptake outer membrane protein n=1 Tax=Pedobacter yulinensis TaxID=2126353 RepID=A0A2T3HPN2_9SPHI|nr:RagB/SusD family nutrient uptake outer membrane protein [Pedobacter yulinensis]PST84402.1 RagB/SusD family nutrient uptake outer membrane protein [Pedobacter yulinensis]